MKKNALVSVYNKENLEYLCAILKKFKIEIISTGSTSNYIEKHGYKCKRIDRLINFKEILNGRVKTLHPKIHASLLFDRQNKDHINEFKLLKFPIIDFVIVNLYPFEAFSSRQTNIYDYIEMIDIGGSSLLRSAAKNYNHVTVISNINEYKRLDKNLNSNNGKTSINFRKKMAAKVFQTTSFYDSQIANSISKPKDISVLIPEKNKRLLRYGENPHQKSFFYSFSKKTIFFDGQIQGKKLSYNNILDIDSAYNCIAEFNLPTCVIVKHNNPCGVASSTNINKAFSSAKDCDPISSFGGIIAFNKSVNEKLALNIIKGYFEIIIAPNYSDKSLKIFQNKKNLILIKFNNLKIKKQVEVKSVNNGYLFQEKNNIIINNKDLKCVTKNKVKAKTLNDLLFAFKICKHVKSNAIVLAKNNKTLGIGAGQMSRIDATKIAITKLKNKNIKFVAASDAFFPFADNLKYLIKHNCKAIVQPKGSINDNKIINFANINNLPLYFAKYRFFKH